MLIPSAAASGIVGALLGVLCVLIYRSIPDRWLTDADSGETNGRPYGFKVCLLSVFSGAAYLFIAVMLCPNPIVIAGLMLVLPALYTAVVSDVQNKVIPDQCAFYIVAVALLLRFCTAYMTEGIKSLPGGLTNAVVGGFAACGAVLVLNFGIKRLAKREAFGMGDIKLFAAGGAFVGLDALLYLFIAAFLLAAIPALVRVLKAKLQKTHAAMPFGPFIAAGIYITALLVNITP